MIYTSQNGTTTKTYFGGLYERIDYSDGTYRELTYLQAPTGVFGVASIDHQDNRTINYFLKDHLGSITVVTDESGNKIQTLNFDAWGRRRNPTNWSYNNVPKA